MSNLQFSLQHLFDRGTATPCVARTVPQTHALAQAFFLDETTKQVVMEFSYEVMRHLIDCADIGERIRSEVREGRRRIAAGEVKIQAGGQVAELPSLGALQNDVETFLYKAKLVLRDTGGLFKPLLDQHFEHRYHRARAWSAKEFGPDAPLTQLLEADAGWIKRVLDLRNAVEHPNTAGRLHVRDFHLAIEDERKVVAPPVWWVDEEQPSSIGEDMEAIERNLLTFYEELLCVLLETRLETRPHPLSRALSPVICEIPDKERDRAMPMRYRVVFENVLGTAATEST